MQGKTARKKASRKAKLKRRYLYACSDMKHDVRRKQRVRLKKSA